MFFHVKIDITTARHINFALNKFHLAVIRLYPCINASSVRLFSSKQGHTLSSIMPPPNVVPITEQHIRPCKAKQIGDKRKHSKTPRTFDREEQDDEDLSVELNNFL